MDPLIRPAARKDIPGIVSVYNTSILPGEDSGFGGRLGSPFQDTTKLELSWKEPNIVSGEEVWIAEKNGRIVGCVTVEDRGVELELVNIDVPLELQGMGIGRTLVRYVEERARQEMKRAVTCGTRRNVEGVAWKSLPWWQHLGYRIIHTRKRTRGRVGRTWSERDTNAKRLLANLSSGWLFN